MLSGSIQCPLALPETEVRGTVLFSEEVATLRRAERHLYALLCEENQEEAEEKLSRKLLCLRG
jgi:hypothetical protein